MIVSSRLRHHLRENVLGYIAVFIALTGTASAADGPLPGVNQVGSADIINAEVTAADIGGAVVNSNMIADGQVLSPDVRNNDVTGAQVAPDALDGSHLGGLTGADFNQATLFNDDSLDAEDVSNNRSIGDAEINESTLFNDNSSLTGADFADTSSLGAAEINEASLSGVNADRLEGVDSTTLVTARSDSADSGQCSGSLSEAVEPGVCADVQSMRLHRPGRIFAIASAGWEIASEGGVISKCEIRVDGTAISPVIFHGLGPHEGETAQMPITLQAISPVLPAGLYDVEFLCADFSGAAGATTDIDDQHLSVLALGGL